MTTVELPAAGSEAARSNGQREPGDDRSTQQAVGRAFRPRRAVAATLVAAVLAILSLLAAAEAISRLFDRPLGVLPVGWLSERGQDTAWSDPLALIIAVVVIALGLLLLWLALWPGQPRVVPLRSDRGDVLIGMSPAGLRREAARAAETVDGVARARVTGRNPLWVRIDTPLRDPQDLAEQTKQVVTERIEALSLIRPPRLRVAVHRREE